MLERSRIAEDLLETMGRMFGGVRGGLGCILEFFGEGAAELTATDRGTNRISEVDSTRRTTVRARL